MKKIRTILAYYNGEKFIDEQMQSIVNQVIPEGYEHEIYVYDDGSKKESLDYLRKNGSAAVSNITVSKNHGVFLTFMRAFVEAFNDNVDVVFFADQDDIYMKDKYSRHVKEHEKGFVYVSSGAFEGYYEKNEFNKMNKNLGLGHRMSISVNKIEIDINKFIEQFEKIAKTKYVIRYHDTFLSYGLSISTKVKFIEQELTWGRKNSLSATHSIKKETQQIGSDEYSYYFDIIKPFFEFVYDKKVSIKEYNKALMNFDENYFKFRFLSVVRYHGNNLAMHLKLKGMRNI